MKHECKFCHEDLSLLPPEANVFQHRVGLCAPTHNEVTACLLEIEEGEKKRAAQAIAWSKTQREVRQSRPVWRWLKDRWLWMRFFSWQ